MTFPVQVPIFTYHGNDVTVTWTFAFEVPYQSDGITPALSVFTTLDDVQTPLFLGTDYTISGVGNPTGGSITTTTPVPTGTDITLERSINIDQTTAFPNQGFLASDIEDSLDKLTMICQDLSLGGSGGVAPPPVGTVPPPTPTTLGGVFSLTPTPHLFVTGVGLSGGPLVAQPDYSDLTGTPPALPITPPSPTALGGVFSQAGTTHQFMTGISTSGAPLLAQPSYSDLTGTPPGGPVGPPSPTILGGVFSFTAPAHQFFTSISTTGQPASAQPAAGDITGLAASATTDTTNASNIATGTLAVARGGSGATTTIGTGANVLATSPTLVTPALGTPTALVLTNATGLPLATGVSGVLPAASLPNPSATTLGGIQSKAAVLHNFLTSISTLGVPAAAQPAAADLSDGVTGTGNVVLATSPTLVTPALGTPSAGVLTNCTGLPNASVVGLAASATTDTTNAANISSGLLPAARLPNPTAGTLGGIQSHTATVHQWVSSINTSGQAQLTQPAFADISGVAVAAQLPAPTATTIGGVQSLAPVLHQFLTGISTAGVVTQAQPAFSDISGSVAAAQLPAPTAATLGGVQSLAPVTHQFLTGISTAGVVTQAQPAFADLSGQPTLAQLAGVAAPQIVPTAISGNWILPPMNSNTGSNNGTTASTIFLIPFSLQTAITVTALGVWIAVLSAGGNIQLALYASNNATGRPTGNALMSTASITTAATGAVSGTVTPVALTPGNIYWMAMNADNSTVAMTTYINNPPLGWLYGSATLANLFAGTNVAALTGLSVAQAFGTWPSLTSASFTEINGKGTILALRAQ